MKCTPEETYAARKLWARCAKGYTDAAAFCKYQLPRWLAYIVRSCRGEAPEKVEQRVIGRLHRITLEIRDKEEKEAAQRVMRALQKETKR